MVVSMTTVVTGEARVDFVGKWALGGVTGEWALGGGIDIQRTAFCIVWN